MTLNDAQQIFGFFFAIYFFMILDRSNEIYKPWEAQKDNITLFLSCLYLKKYYTAGAGGTSSGTTGGTIGGSVVVSP
jgi:hypothetical protein